MKRIRPAILFLLLSMLAPGIFAASLDLIRPDSDIIKILYDDSGTPHVIANNDYGVFFGYGYCLGRDRMFQLELLRRSTEGTLSEVFGEEFIETDFLARRDRVSYEELAQGLKTCSERFATAITAFTNGINRAVEEGRSRKFPLDKAFSKAGINPTPFSQLQILNIFAGTMAARYNDFSMELDNMRLLNSLVRKYGAREASQIFEDVAFYQDKKTYTTLGSMPYFKPGFRHIPRFSPSADYVKPSHSPTLQTQKRNQLLKAIGIPDKSGSYGLVMSLKDKGKKGSLVFGGPQMGYFKPSAVYSVGLHTPEFDIVGTTPVGYAFLMFAANREIAFTATAGVGNLVDLIALKIDPQKPGIIKGNNYSAKVTRRIESFYVKGQKKPIEREILETELGPVTAIEGNNFFVKQRAWKGLVVESYDAWFRSTFSENIDEWLVESDKNALSINWMAGDRQGNIAFVHCGLGKSRKSFGDDRLPVDMPTDFLTPEKRLARVNSPTSFFANWNCPPVDGYRNGDLQTNWAADQRTRYLADHATLNQQYWSKDYLIQLDKDLAFTDLRAHFFKDLLISFIDSHKLSQHQKSAVEKMRNWNNLRLDNDGDGFFDNEATGLFNAFYNDLFNKLFAEKLGDFAWMSASDATWTQSAILANALLQQSHHDYLQNRKASDIVTEVFIQTFNGLVSEKMTLPPFAAPPMEFANVNHVNAPTMVDKAAFSPFMNRGSDIQIVELTPDSVKIFGCTPPGNSATGELSESSMQDFKNFKFRPRPLTIQDLKSVKAGRYMVIQP